MGGGCRGGDLTGLGVERGGGWVVYDEEVGIEVGIEGTVVEMFLWVVTPIIFCSMTLYSILFYFVYLHRESIGHES